ncbi:MAG: hypothetical protein H6744_14830 [Deltaproteobacteria bacterium]|nr:hypothetical protein [Deltaproteobacteria bacterium]
MRNALSRLALASLLVTAGCASETPAASDATVDAAPDSADTAGGDADTAGGDANTLDAGGDLLPETDGPPPAPAFCEGDTAYMYDPRGAVLTTFPDDWLTRPDASTRTGVAVELSAERAPWRAGLPIIGQDVMDAIATLDGFGTTAGIALRFTGPLGPVPSGEEASVASDALQLLELTASGGQRVPFEVERTDDDGLILWPMIPLRPATRFAVVMSRALTDADGACVAPSAALRTLVQGQDLAPGPAGLGQRYVEALAAAHVEPADVSAAVVFTTQSIVEETRAIAADIRTRTYDWVTPPVCEDKPLFRDCSGTFGGNDYRTDSVVAGTAPTRPLTLPVRIWLPYPGTGGSGAGIAVPPLPPAPVPAIMFGHGLASDRGQASALAPFAAPQGLATVAIDAVAHGDHPDASGAGSKIEAVIDFFAIDIERQSLNALVLRDHWRQSTWEKLQLIELLRQHPDIDGDGAADIDITRLVYLGASLGGIMGPELLALSPDIGLGVLSVPGGRVSSIISDSELFSPIVTLMAPVGTPKGELRRFFPLLQTVLERGDSANFGPYVLHDRFDGAGPAPHVLMAMAIDDNTVPNVANRSVARALGLPQVGQVRQVIGVVPRDIALPLAGNLEGGQLTAGVFQYDRIRKSSEAAVEKATHDNLTKSYESVEQLLHFITTWLDTGVPELIDPYVVLDTPPLPPAEETP